MSTSRHIDIICLAVSVFALLITGLFINARALGITPVSDTEILSSQFTANDLMADWDTAGATLITLTGDGGSVKGSGAYVYGGDVYIIYAGKYVISGELTNGSLIVDADGDDKVWILLDGVSLRREDSAAILVEQAEKVFLTLADGTENFISGGAEYSAAAVSGRIDGAIYSRDDLTINGGGSLSVSAEYRHGIVCNDDLAVTGGKIEITAAQDGIHANDSARFAEMDITISAGDDGITVSNDDESAYIYIESGNISIPSCYEGIEAIDITVAGGLIDIRPIDDGINANGRGGDSVIRITGGGICIINETGRDADGLDSNGSIYISGGNIFISVNGSGGSCALDYGTENGGVCQISGGTVIAAGGSTMADGFDPSSEQNFIMYTTSTAAAGSTVTLKSEAGNTLVSEIIPCSFSSIVISTPDLKLGEICTVYVNDSPEEITVDNSSGSDGFGIGFMPGKDMRQDGMFGGRGDRAGQAFEGLQDASDLRRDPQDIPELPDENAGRAEMPQRPDGDFADGEIPQPPFDGFARAGDRRGGGQFTQWRQDQARENSADEASALSPGPLIQAAASILVLLAGIIIALKTKH